MTAWAARAQVNYKPNKNTLLYASWNRGVKSGGFNAPLLPTAVFVTNKFMNYSPEKLDAYEVGFKLDFAEGRARLNGSAYYYNYRNYQAFAIVGLDTFTLNADSKNKGFELELKLNPTEGLDVQFGIAYIDARVRDVPGITIDVATPQGTVNAMLPGATVRPVQTPKWNLNGLIRREFSVGPCNISLQADGQYRSKHTFGLLSTQALTSKGYFVGNVSVTYLPTDQDWSVRLFVKNFTGKNYLVQTFDLSGTVANGGLFGLVEQYYGRPRTWGVNMSYKF